MRQESDSPASGNGRRVMRVLYQAPATVRLPEEGMEQVPLKNVFVLGLSLEQKVELEAMARAEPHAFHYLFSSGNTISVTVPGYPELLSQSRNRLLRFGISIDAIVCHWSYPANMIGPLLAEENGLRERRAIRLENRHSIPGLELPPRIPSAWWFST